MIVYGYLVYVLLAAILWAFWTKVRGRTFDDLIQQSADDHHRALEFHRKHPHGGTWKEVRPWLES